MSLSRQIVLVALCCVMIGIIVTEVGAGVQKEKYIIHVPIKYHTVHHVKVQKVPVFVKKHIHHHKHEPEEHHHEQQQQLQHGYDRYDEYSDEKHGAYGSYENSDEYY